MELKKEAQELKLIDEVNRLSLEELEKKYLKNENSYNEFINQYTELFRNRVTYQLRVADKYDTIFRLFKDGLEKYPSEEAIEKTASVIDTIAYVTQHYQVSDVKSPEDKYQAHALLKIAVGAEDSKNTTLHYSELIRGISECCFDYANKSDGFSIDSYRTFISDTIDKYDNIADIKREIDIYKNSNKLCSRCNDVNFLYFVNYMLKLRTSMVDEAFVKDAKDIIDMGKVTRRIDGLSGIEAKNYNRVARVTKKNIKEYERRIAKEEKLEKGIQKSKINHAFKTRHI